MSKTCDDVCPTITPKPKYIQLIITHDHMKKSRKYSTSEKLEPVKFGIVAEKRDLNNQSIVRIVD